MDPKTDAWEKSKKTLIVSEEDNWKNTKPTPQERAKY